MKLKVTLRYVIVLIKISLCACNSTAEEDELIRYNEQVDLTSSHRIDSAYKKINAECDSALKYRVPEIVDSLLKIKSVKYD